MDKGGFVMNTKQLQYVLKLSETRKFSQVAEQMGITQPALSKQIQHIEKELGVKLFDRNHSPLTLTPAGEYFVRSAREMVYREEQLRKAMEQFASESLHAGLLIDLISMVCKPPLPQRSPICVNESWLTRSSHFGSS